MNPSRYYYRFFARILTIVGAPIVLGCSPHSVNLEAAPSIEIENYSQPTDRFPKSDDQSIELVPWWEIIEDRQLSRYIKIALSDNLTLAEAEERILQAQAFASQAKGLRLPLIAASGLSQHSWDGDGVFTKSYGAGGLLEWDPDLFGRLKSRELARVFELEAQREEYEYVKLLLSQAVAETYLSAIEQKLQMALLHKQVEVDRELLQLIQSSFDAGVVSRVDVLQQKGQLADSEARLPLAELTLRAFENRLDLLLGQAPDGQDRFTTELEFPVIQIPKEVGVPSDLLLNRPDLRARRAVLIAADAEIGSAIAERLPVISLGANTLYVAGSDPTGFASSVMGAIFQPLLDWGIRKSEVERNESLYRERLADFTNSYLQGIEEVENSMYQVEKQAEYLKKLEIRKDILAETISESQRRYSSGLTDYLPVLDAIKDLRELERDIVEQHRILLIYHVRYFVSLGGMQPVLNKL